MGKQNRKSRGTQEYDVFLTVIKEAREKSGLSQREIARRLGFHSTIYGKIERGERVMDVVEFVNFCDSVGTSAEDLITEYSRQKDSL